MTDTNDAPDLSRRSFVGAATTMIAGATLAHGVRATDAHGVLRANASDDFAIAELSISQLSSGMKSGQYTAHYITQQYLDRIASLDRQGPMLRHVIETNPDAI